MVKTLMVAPYDIISAAPYFEMPNTSHPEFKERWGRMTTYAQVDVAWNLTKFVAWWLQTCPVEEEGEIIRHFHLPRLLPCRSQSSSILPP
jgi:hypothetical protein